MPHFLDTFLVRVIKPLHQGSPIFANHIAHMRSGSIYPIYVASLFSYALFKMLTTLLKHTFQNGGQDQEASVYVLYLGSWQNDLNNVVGIDNIYRDQRHK